MFKTNHPQEDLINYITKYNEALRKYGGIKNALEAVIQNPSNSAQAVMKYHDMKRELEDIYIVHPEQAICIYKFALDAIKTSPYITDLSTYHGREILSTILIHELQIACLREILPAQVLLGLHADDL